MPPENAKNGTKAARANFLCLLSNSPIETKYIRSEAQAGRMKSRLLAIVAEGKRPSCLFVAYCGNETIAATASPTWKPDLLVTTPCHDIDRLPMYGMYTWGDAFTSRQLVALTTFSDLILEAREMVKEDALKSGMMDNDQGLDADGSGAKAYGEAMAVYLACALSKIANIGSTIASWMNDRGAFRETFARQAIPMTWDYAEANPFSSAGGSFSTAIDKGVMAIQSLPVGWQGKASQENASIQALSNNKIVSTDPPYYDNISYADLSDFFYVWLRRALRPIYPGLFSTIAVPKVEELVATPYRHGSKEKAESFFLQRYDRSDAPVSGAGTPGFSNHYLLRLQTV